MKQYNDCILSLGDNHGGFQRCEMLKVKWVVYPLVGEPRDQNKANFNTVRQIAKFGMIVYYKIVINNLI